MRVLFSALIDPSCGMMASTSQDGRCGPYSTHPSVVHGRPAAAEFFELQPLNAALLDEEKAVLVLGLAAVDLIDKNRLGLPHGGWSFNIADGACFFIGPREAHEAIERDEARVVVSVHEPESLREALVFPVPALPTSRSGSPLANAARMMGSTGAQR